MLVFFFYGLLFILRIPMIRISFTVVVVTAVQAQGELLRASRMAFSYLDTTSDVLCTKVNLVYSSTFIRMPTKSCDLATTLTFTVFECDIRVHLVCILRQEPHKVQVIHESHRLRVHATQAIL